MSINDKLLKEECLICFENFSLEKNNIKKCSCNCNFYYHSHCINEWHKKNHECPVCNKKVKLKKIKKKFKLLCCFINI